MSNWKEKPIKFKAEVRWPTIEKTLGKKWFALKGVVLAPTSTSLCQT
jgi:hypothetical protein